MPVAEVTIESIAAGGDGVARADGMVVFVPRSAPGDVGRVLLPQPSSGHPRYLRAALAEIHTPSPARIDPPCPHYTRDRCGGCQLQHIRYDAQLDAKARVVADALQRIGRRAVEPPSVERSPDELRYRRKLTLALRRRRGGQWLAGLHPFDEPARVFRLDDCLITHESVMRVWRAILAVSHTLPADRELRAAVRVDEHGASFLVEGGERWPQSGILFEKVPELNAVWWVPKHGGRQLLHRRGAETSPGASFAQVNPQVAAALRSRLLELTRRHEPRTAIDGYAGTGDVAVALAAAGTRVVAVELDGDAAAWCARRLPAGSRSVAARVEDVLPSLMPADLIVLNPPRAGLAAEVTTTLRETRDPPHAIIYVSCNPATLARDLSRLPGYRIASLTAFDMFPQTAHVETLCELVPGRAETDSSAVP